MMAVKSTRPKKAKFDHLSRPIFFDCVGDGAMTTNGTNAKRAIKAHGGPALWPEAVIVGSKGINKCSDNAGSGGDFSFMVVENLHKRYSFDAQRGSERPARLFAQVHSTERLCGICTDHIERLMRH